VSEVKLAVVFTGYRGDTHPDGAEGKAVPRLPREAGHVKKLGIRVENAPETLLSSNSSTTKHPCLAIV